MFRLQIRRKNPKYSNLKPKSNVLAQKQETLNRKNVTVKTQSGLLTSDARPKR